MKTKELLHFETKHGKIVHIPNCLIDTCNRPRFGQQYGYCNAHYQRLMRVGDVMPDKPLQQVIRVAHKYPEGSICQVDGCGRRMAAKNFCASHYRNYLLGYNTERPIKTLNYYHPGTLCSIDHCNRKVRSARLCETHYRRYLVGADLLKQIGYRRTSETNLETPT